MTESKRVNNQINFKNRKKMNSTFKGNDLRRSNCFNSDFTGSDFNDTSFRGAQFKACKFDECTFDQAELVATNLKNSQFKNVKFSHTVFDTANLENVDFEGAVFENVIFVNTDLSQAKNVNLEGQKVQIFETAPILIMSKALQKSVETAMTNPYIKFARVLDTKEGKVNSVSMMLLLERFEEEELIKGLKLMKDKIDKDFCTLNQLVGYLDNYKEEGLI
ncbi:MAG: pentapeptide repeat-containing protein [Cellulosilyticaceae bacterium]